MSAIERCRTAALGGHVEECDQCGHQRIAYNSCRNRHCPKCQATAAAEWMEARKSELLPVEYYHVVFTLPAALGPIALQNQRVVYGLLFRAAAETLQQIAADPKHLGAEIGFLAVLHTWGQNLQHHPHVHCVVPGGEKKVVTLTAIDFIRRFLLHVLPTGFVRIRHYGFLANRVCREKLELCRALLNATATSESVAAALTTETKGAVEGQPAAHACP